MSAVMGFTIMSGEIRIIPKLGLNAEEVAFAYGNSSSLVRQLRAIKALVVANKDGKTLLFDHRHVAEVWDRYVAGEFADQLAALPGGELRRLRGMEADEFGD